MVNAEERYEGISQSMIYNIMQRSKASAIVLRIPVQSLLLFFCETPFRLKCPDAAGFMLRALFKTAVSFS
jgi:hypothetical protein